MAAFLGAKDLSRVAFVQMVKDHAFPDDALFMATTPAATRFDKFTFDEPFFLQSDGGRIFWPTGELKWRKMDGDSLRTVYLGDDAPPAGLENFSEELEALPETNPVAGRFILWGARTNKENEWIEQQVPHRFEYPMQTSKYSRGRVALKTENWVDRSGCVRFSRYCDIEEIEGED